MNWDFVPRHSNPGSLAYNQPLLSLKKRKKALGTKKENWGVAWQPLLSFLFRQTFYKFAEQICRRLLEGQCLIQTRPRAHTFILLLVYSKFVKTNLLIHRKTSFSYSRKIGWTILRYFGISWRKFLVFCEPMRAVRRKYNFLLFSEWNEGIWGIKFRNTPIFLRKIVEYEEFIPWIPKYFARYFVARKNGPEGIWTPGLSHAKGVIFQLIYRPERSEER